jgi:MFS family permease
LRHGRERPRHARLGRHRAALSDQYGIGALAALPVNLFNRLMTVELAWPAILPGLLVALHYGVQLTRPFWGHRSDAKGGRTPFILGGVAVVGLGLILAAYAIAYVSNPARPDVLDRRLRRDRPWHRGCGNVLPRASRHRRAR